MVSSQRRRRGWLVQEVYGGEGLAAVWCARVGVAAVCVATPPLLSGFRLIASPIDVIGGRTNGICIIGIDRAWLVWDLRCGPDRAGHGHLLILHVWKGRYVQRLVKLDESVIESWVHVEDVYVRTIFFRQRQSSVDF